LLFSALVPCAGFAALAFCDSVPVANVLFLFIAAMGLTRPQLVQNYMHKHIASESRATVLSFASMAAQAVRALLYPIVGIMVDASLRWAMLGLAAFCLPYCSRGSKSLILLTLIDFPEPQAVTFCRQPKNLR
jgi:hypothetical protein